MKLQFRHTNFETTEFERVVLPKPDSEFGIFSGSCFHDRGLCSFESPRRSYSRVSEDPWIMCGDIFLAWDSLTGVCIHSAVRMWYFSKFSKVADLNGHDECCQFALVLGR